VENYLKPQGEVQREVPKNPTFKCTLEDQRDLRNGPMKALVTGFRMPYRLSPDSKYPLSGVNTGPIENTGPKSSTRSRRFPAIGAETREEEDRHAAGV